MIKYSPFYQHYLYDRVYAEDGHFNWSNLNFLSIKGVDEHLILLSVFFPLTDRTREDLKEIKKQDRKHQWKLKDFNGISDPRGRSVSPNCSPLLKASIADWSVTICLYHSWAPQKQFRIHERISPEDPAVLQFIHLPLLILSASDMRDYIPWTRWKRPRMFVAPC